MSKQTTPKYRLHKPTGQAVVTLNGKDRYLGKHNTNASRQRYHRLIAEWEASDRQLPEIVGRQTEPTVSQIMLPYWRWARTRYRRQDGSHTSTVSNVQMALRLLRHLYGRLPVSQFGPLGYKHVARR